MLFRNPAILAICIALSACAKSNQAEVRGEETPAVHRVLEGSLEANLLEVVNDSYASESCDLAHRELHLEITRELDRRADEINKLSQSIVQDTADMKKIPLGESTYALAPLTRPTPKSGWQTQEYHWQEIREYYQKIKGTPTDQRWVWLNQDVRGIIPDDQDRVLSAKNIYLNKDSGAPLAKLKAELERCQQDPNCSQPNLAPLAFFVFEQPYYSYFDNLLAKASSAEESRNILGRFIRRVNNDSRYYTFRKNPAVTFSGETLKLPLVGSAFAGYLPQVEEIIKSIWNGEHGKSFQIEWADSNPHAFRFVLFPTVGGRAYVVPDEKTINLFNGTKPGTFAHEIGHVLGFRDNYFTTWTEKECKYTSQTLEEDIMANSSKGKVLPHHWETLKAQYLETIELYPQPENSAQLQY